MSESSRSNYSDNLEGYKTNINLELIDIVTNSDIHMCRAAFTMPTFKDLQAIVTWYADGRPVTLFMNRRNNTRLTQLLSVGLPISDKAERERQVCIARKLTSLKLSRFGRTIRTQETYYDN